MILVFNFLFLILTSRAETIASVRVLEAAPVPQGGVIYFKDVAQFEDFPAEFKAEVENIKVAENEVEFSKMSSFELLSQVRPVLKRIERECQCKISLTLPRSLQNHTMQGTFTLEKLTAKLTQSLQTQCPDCVYTLEPLKVYQGDVPQEYASWEIENSTRHIHGPAIVSVYFDQKALNPLLLKTHVSIKKPILRLKRSHSQGAVLGVEDLLAEVADVTYETKKLATAADLPNTEIRRTLAATQILYAEDLVEQHVVRLGEPLSVEISKGSFHISVSGIAQKSGRKGDRIPVRVDKTRKDIVAEVLGEGRARMQR